MCVVIYIMIVLLSVVSPFSSSIELIIFSARQAVGNISTSRCNAPVVTGRHATPPVIHKLVYCVRIFAVVTALGAL